MNNRSRLVTAPLKLKHNFYASFVLIPRLKIEFSIVTSVINAARTVCKKEGDFTYLYVRKNQVDTHLYCL